MRRWYLKWKKIQSISKGSSLGSIRGLHSSYCCFGYCYRQCRYSHRKAVRCKVGWSGEWSANDRLNEIGSNDADSVKQNSENVLQNQSANEQKKVVPSADDATVSAKSYKQVETLANQSEIHNSDVVLDVDPQPQSNIKGAVHIDYREFLDGSNRPRSISTLSKILGDAGISRGDSVVIESKNPSDATYVYLILDYLGQDGVKLLGSHIDGELPRTNP